MALEHIQNILSKSDRLQAIPHLSPQPATSALGLATLLSDQRLTMIEYFNHRVRILIPTTIDVNHPMDTSAFVDKANTLFNQSFGGSLRKEFLGFYESDEFGTVKEPIFEVEAFTHDLGLKKAQYVLQDFIMQLLVELRQETVLIAVDNEAALLALAPDKKDGLAIA